MYTPLTSLNVFRDEIRCHTVRILDNLGKLVKLPEELEPDSLLEGDELGRSSIYQNQSSNLYRNLSSIGLIAKGGLAIVAILFGYKYLRLDENTAQLNAKRKQLKIDKDLFSTFRSFYTTDYYTTVEKAFASAHHVLKERKPEESYIKMLRITLLAFTIIGAIGWYRSSNTLKLIGCSYSLFASLCLCVKQGMSAYEEWKHNNTLQNLIKIARRDRLESESINFNHAARGADPSRLTRNETRYVRALN